MPLIETCYPKSKCVTVVAGTQTFDLMAKSVFGKLDADGSRSNASQEGDPTEFYKRRVHNSGDQK